MHPARFTGRLIDWLGDFWLLPFFSAACIGGTIGSVSLVARFWREGRPVSSGIMAVFGCCVLACGVWFATATVADVFDFIRCELYLKGLGIGRCQCGYDLTGNARKICPGCGRMILPLRDRRKLSGRTLDSGS